MKNILLVEPAYKNKYPPLGLMKISTFHKMKGHNVVFVKGCCKEIRTQKWDRIYIATLFSFYWNYTVKTIKYYRNIVGDINKIKVGGVLATIMANELEKETGIKPVKGLLNVTGKLGYKNDDIIDTLTPDYSILDQIDYKYPANDAYFGYMTKGCKRKCPFCAVNIMEPKYVHYIPMKKQINIIKKKYGEKKDLLLLDNNVLASSYFDKIVDEILEMGFYKGAKLNGFSRYVDFNQGIDARFLTKAKFKRLAELPVKPLRIAFDYYSLRNIYKQKIRWAAECGFTELSNYILYNYKDTPEEFYSRLKINIRLNEELGTKIFSFPMKYVPNNSKNRSYVGQHWNIRYLRGIQCVLNATHGVVGHKRQFFQTAFGKNLDEFRRILLMPDDYIIYRSKHKSNGAMNWWNTYSAFTPKQKRSFHAVVYENDFRTLKLTSDTSVNKLLKLYYKK